MSHETLNRSSEFSSPSIEQPSRNLHDRNESNIYSSFTVQGHASAVIGNVYNYNYVNHARAFDAVIVSRKALAFLRYSIRLMTDDVYHTECPGLIPISTVQQSIKGLEELYASLNRENLHSHEGQDLAQLALVEAIVYCRGLAVQLLTYVQRLRTRIESNPNKRWLGFLAVLHDELNSDQFASLICSLREARDQISARCNAYFREQLRRDDGAEMSHIMALVREDQSEHNTAGELAIATFNDGSRSTFTREKYANSRDFRSLNTSKYNKIELKNDHSGRTVWEDARLGDDNTNAIFEAVADSLTFPTITDRFDSITTAHETTFDWIFQEPRADQEQWSDFRAWLSQGSECYWVYGKPASGKSTLLKYLWHDKRLWENLATWTGDCTLIKANHYFWYRGTDLQRSHLGLIRSILLDVIRGCPQMVFTLFPDACRNLISNGVDRSFTLRDTELKKALKCLPHEMPRNFKLFLLIDGIDEYEGDWEELSAILRSASASPAIKILLSSRPETHIKQDYSKYPKLRLQDLTHDDIYNYTRERLHSHPELVNYEDPDQDGICAEEILIKAITDKASGVFLWVTLVVDQLRRRLTNNDSLDALLKIVDSLPRDLGQLYDRILGSIEEDYIDEGARIMHATQQSIEWDRGYPMTASQMWFIIGGYEICLVDASVRSTDAREEARRYNRVENRLSCCCRGLVEILNLKRYGETIKIINFLHRTVFEFLVQSTSSCALEGFRRAPDHLEEIVLGSSIQDLRTLNRMESISEHTDYLSYHAVCRTLRYSAAIEFSDSRKERFLQSVVRALLQFVSTRGSMNSVHSGWMSGMIDIRNIFRVYHEEPFPRVHRSSRNDQISSGDVLKTFLSRTGLSRCYTEAHFFVYLIDCYHKCAAVTPQPVPPLHVKELAQALQKLESKTSVHEQRWAWPLWQVHEDAIYLGDTFRFPLSDIWDSVTQGDGNPKAAAFFSQLGSSGPWEVCNKHFEDKFNEPEDEDGTSSLPVKDGHRSGPEKERVSTLGINDPILSNRVQEDAINDHFAGDVESSPAESRKVKKTKYWATGLKCRILAHTKLRRDNT